MQSTLPKTRSRLEELSGAIRHIRYPVTDSNWSIVTLSTGETCVGEAEPGSIFQNLPYRFMGMWHTHERFGRQFKFSAHVQQQPETRDAVITYLLRCTEKCGIGAATARKLVDNFGPASTLPIMRTDPSKVAQSGLLTLPNAKAAAQQLEIHAANEGTRLELVSLLANRGFPNTLIDQLIKRYKVQAANIIRRNPFTLLVNKFAGCGFLRVDQLYLDLGLRPASLKRQMFAAVHSMRTNNGGSVWHSKEWIQQRVGEMVATNVDAGRAVRLGLKAGYFELRTADDEGWIAEARHADDERRLAACFL